MTKYAHQCRYCAHCVWTCNDVPICEHDDVQTKERGDSLPYPFRQPNDCEYWSFTPLAADYCGNDRKVYKPRKRSPFKQTFLFGILTNTRSGYEHAE